MIQLSEQELVLVRSALQAYRQDFGHEESDVLQMVKALLVKLPRAGRPVG